MENNKFDFLKNKQSEKKYSLNEIVEILEDGKDILHVTLSSGISNTVQSANAAADLLRPEYPDRKLYIVDSLCASSGSGLFVDLLADRRDAGDGRAGRAVSGRLVRRP